MHDAEIMKTQDGFLMITVNVLGSSGPLRFVVNIDDKVSEVINLSLKMYARGGRLPVLGSDYTKFLLYPSNSDSEEAGPSSNDRSSIRDAQSPSSSSEPEPRLCESELWPAVVSELLQEQGSVTSLVKTSNVPVENASANNVKTQGESSSSAERKKPVKQDQLRETQHREWTLRLILLLMVREVRAFAVKLAEFANEEGDMYHHLWVKKWRLQNVLLNLGEKVGSEFDPHGFDFAKLIAMIMRTDWRKRGYDSEVWTSIIDILISYKVGLGLIKVDETSLKVYKSEIGRLLFGQLKMKDKSEDGLGEIVFLANSLQIVLLPNEPLE
ncbi:potassium transporter 19-like protein [Tanacetum coccineum]